MKRLTSLAALLIMAVVYAFGQQATPLALQKEVKTGVLPNGLTYYILHNEKPKDRANFYIAQKVGSALEAPDQLGLAHFLEHMAFNGITHYPGKNMTNYLESKGIRFGADINAYTAFDQTVYNINNVITTDKPLMDSVLLVIRDWCDGILLEESEIEAERGVINEEWRSRNDAQSRMLENVLPKVFKEYQYQQTPIGKMEVVMNFKPEVLRAYYKKWYRPDLQGIVIVGDIDADEMERKVKELFSTVVMPENAAPREYVAISDNKEPIVAVFQDPELQNTLVMTYFKSDKTPVEFRNTVEGYMSDNLLPRVIRQMIQNRLSEYVTNPECPYAMAQVTFGDFLVANTKDAFTIYVVPKADEIVAAYAGARGIVARACQAGFTQTELDRVSADIMSSMEKAFNEKDKTINDAYANQLINHFLSNKPALGIETEYNIVKNILPNLPVELYNQAAQSILTPDNQVIVVSQPLKENVPAVKEAEMAAALESVLNASYEAYVDEVVTEPLISNLPKPGQVKSAVANPANETTTFMLSNGVKVLLKTTDYKADEVIMFAFRDGGKQMYGKDLANEVLLIDDAVSLSKIGNFDVNMMRKYLAGKHVGVGFSVNSFTDMLQGMSTVKDLGTLMELIYASFTDLNPDPTTYHSQIDKVIPIFESRADLPETVYEEQKSKTIYGDNPLMNEVTADVLKNADYEKMVQMAKAAVANAADYTFIFVGNVDEATLRPMLEQYIATLPSKGKADKVKVESVNNPVMGKVVNKFDKAMQAPYAEVYNEFNGTNLTWNVKNNIMVDLMGDVLNMVFLETLREDEGGTYGARVGASYNYNNNIWKLQYDYKTAPEKLERMEARAAKELENLLANGAKADHFAKCREAAIKQYEINVKTNSYWAGSLMSAERGYDMQTDYLATLQALTLDDFNKFLKTVYDGKNRIEVIMVGTQAGE
ncbi:MAG: insulinase family protein [Muribaculaceae bacterium]|nr:insulinase family protein [Muribaculaceae bacterium]